MNVLEILSDAICTKDWDKVKEAFVALGGKVAKKQAVPAPAKKRGRPKKADKPIIVDTNPLDVRRNPILIDNPESELRKLIREQEKEKEPDVVFNDDFTVVRKPKARQRVEGEEGKTLARMEPFRPPTEPNKFDPNTQVVESDPNYDRINDNVKRSPRLRPPAISEVPVFCEDCQKTIMIHPQFKREPFRCEYVKLGQKCPRSK